MKIVISILFLFLVFFGISPSYGVEITFILETGFRNGSTKEFVFEGDKCISLLEWNDRVVPTVGFTGQIGVRNFTFRLNLDFAVPVISGEMENYDYLIADSFSPSHYSWHDVYLDKDFKFSIEGGYEIQLKNWYITPSIGMQYLNRKWTATDGYLQYPDMGHWTGNEQKVNLNGPVIGYEQAVWYPFAALETGFTHIFPFECKIRVSIKCGIYPYIWAETNDNHFLRNTQFYDSLRGGIGGFIGIFSSFFPVRTNGIGFIFYSGSEIIKNVKGSTSSKNTGIANGPLIITEGYSGKTEIMQWYTSLSIFIPIHNRDIQ